MSTKKRLTLEPRREVVVESRFHPVGTTDRCPKLQRLMPTPKYFLVIDGDDDLRQLVVRTLIRVFPGSIITESTDRDEALHLIKANEYDAIVVHRAIGSDAVTLIRLIRQDNPRIPVLAVSSMDRSKEVLAAGATEFLNFEEWLRVGTVVAGILAHPQTEVV